MLGFVHAEPFLRVSIIIRKEHRCVEHLDDEAADAITILGRQLLVELWMI